MFGAIVNFPMFIFQFSAVFSALITARFFESFELATGSVASHVAFVEDDGASSLQRRYRAISSDATTQFIEV